MSGSCYARVALGTRRTLAKAYPSDAFKLTVNSTTTMMVQSISTTGRVPYYIEPVLNEAALPDIEADWNRLCERASSPNVFTTVDWYRAWTSRFASDDPGRSFPNLLVLQQNDVVVGIAPFIRRISSLLGVQLQKLEFVTNHADYNEIVLGGDQATQLDAVMSFLSETSGQWDVMDLRELLDAEGNRARIESSLQAAGLLYRILPEEDACPYLPIEGDSSSAIKRLSGDARRVLRKRTEKAAHLGLRLRIIENPHQEPELLNRLIALDQRCHLQKQWTPFISKYPEVSQSLFQNLGPRGWLCVAVLESENELAGYQISFRCGDKLWDYTKAYDRAFSNLAPGTLIFTALLDYGFSCGFSEYDFLRGEEPYKLVWSTGFHRRFRILIWNSRWTSRVRKFFYHDARAALRGVLGKRS